MEIVFSGDKKKMNWLREDYPYASVKCPDEFTWKVSNEWQGDELTTTIIIKNESRHPYFTNKGSIGISFPLADTYTESRICRDYRCHGHIWCGEDTSYIMALRMGGDAPHLGMVLTEGNLSAYSIERDTEHSSNDRGCFWLHPSPKEFAPGAVMKLSWKVFPHNGREDFKEKLKNFASVIQVEAEHWVIYPGEKTAVKIRPSFEAQEVLVNSQKLTKEKDGTYTYSFQEEKTGEYVLKIRADRIKTRCRLLVQERPEKIIEKRCAFIAENQQYHGEIKELQGAYLGYDNEEHHLVCTPENDFNAGRERLGMGVLMARYLLKNGAREHEQEEKSLREYREFVLQELADETNGEVYNNAGRDNSYVRLYNFPWVTSFFLECWKLWKKEEDLKFSFKVLDEFYKRGGYHFYPVEMPIAELCRELKAAGKKGEWKQAEEMLKKHADCLLVTGTDYPASEVNYEQSIVAPAADILLQAYEITGEEKYLEGARLQMRVLELFNGHQPDYHLYEVAIRHWDGYWFGKNRLYGDTFPHYWSAQTGKVFRRYAKLTGDNVYAKRAENSFRGVLSMFFEDGTATCAYMFPYIVNGQRGEYADPYANDQDWGLCAYLE